MNRSATHTPWSIGVVIPARDEEAVVVDCLDSVLSAIDGCSRVGSSFVVLVADSCGDRTADRARRRLRQRGTVVECSARSAGVARRLGVEQVIAAYPGADLSRVWIANTDADSCVPIDWIEQQLRLAESGYCAVAGLVSLHASDAICPDLRSSWLRDYAGHADGTHPHVHGANLGIRADIYQDIGGWSTLALAEDHCLWSRLRAKGVPVFSSTANVVSTSGRLVGRAVGGFADSLRSRLDRLTS